MQQPCIDPHYFENDFGAFLFFSVFELFVFPITAISLTRAFFFPADLEIMVQHIKFAKSMIDIEPWKSLVAREVDPGPKCTTDQEIRGASVCTPLIPIP